MTLAAMAAETGSAWGAPALAAELVRRQVAVIAATGGPPAVLAAKAATTTIPIVFVSGDDPVRLGFVTNLARPDGNLTGISFFNAELAAKRLELLRELVPGAARVAVLVNPANAAIAETTLRDLEGAARAMALQIQVLNASTSREISAAFATLGRENRPPKGKGGPRLGSVDKGWCCHERGLNDSESCGARNCDFSRITGTGRIGGSCRPPIAYSRVDTGRNPSAVPSNSNFPASHLGSQLGLIAQSYRAFSSPPLGRPTPIAPSGGLLAAVATSQGRPPARQHQGPEVVVRSVRASSIRAIAIMTRAVETNRILGLSAKLVCDTSLSSELYGELFLPICNESTRYGTTMTLAQSEPKIVYRIAPEAQAIFCRRRHQPRRPPLAKIRSERKFIPRLQKVASLHCGSTMSQGNSRTNGIPSREANSQPDCEDRRDIGHLICTGKVRKKGQWGRMGGWCRQD